ncbi:MAG: protease HtpX [Elusimicrobia bacterium]|nr:protease HtpX [Elusimicrobiota bacterium]
MQWAKRIVLFLAVNILVVLTISISLQLLGVRPYLSARGIDYNQLMIFCLVWGMGGAFISLALSRIMAKWMMGVQVIDPQSATGAEADLVQMVHRLAQAANLPKMPQVGVYDSPEVNAFATGPTRARALVAVSSGILAAMDRRELEAVLGHEITHVANGDMVTMTLIQGVVNAFVMFLARVIAYFLTQNQEKEEGRYWMRYLLTMVFEVVFSILGSIVVAWFSRWREFRADAGGAQLAGRGNMIAALKSLQRNAEGVDMSHSRAVNTLKIAGPRSLLALFASHPPIPERIAALERAA